MGFPSIAGRVRGVGACVAALAAGLAPSCREPEPVRSEVVVAIASQRPGAPTKSIEITRDDVARAFARARLERDGNLDAPPLVPSLRRKVLDDLIESKLFRLEAEALGITASSTVVDRELAAMKQAMPEDRFRERLIATYQSEELLRKRIEERLLASELTRRVEPRPVTEADVKAAWDALSFEEKTRPARVRASQILAPTEQVGQEILKRLEKGEDFQELARAFDPDTGGDLGWFAQGEMPPVIETACFGLEPGTHSGLIPSEYGHHIFRVHEREPRRVRTFKEAHAELKQRLMDQRMREAQERLRRRLADAYAVTRNQELADRLTEKGP